MRILIIKASSLGDIVHAFPAIRYLRQQLPTAVIEWVVEKPFADLVRANPDVDATHVIETKTWRKNLFSRSTWREVMSLRKQLRQNKYDLVIDLQGNTKSACIVFQVNALKKIGFDIPYAVERPSTWTVDEKYLPPQGYNVRQDYLYLVQKAINGPQPTEDVFGEIPLTLTDKQIIDSRNQYVQWRDDGKKLALVFCGSAWRNKQLPEPDLTILLQFIQQKYAFKCMLAWGTQEEKMTAEKVAAKVPHASVIDRLPLPVLQNLMGKMDLVISMDSLPLHLAATSGVPTYSFFGPSAGKKYAPQGKRHLFYQGECPFKISFERRCPKLRTCPTGDCLRKTDVDAVVKHFDAWWKSIL